MQKESSIDDYLRRVFGFGKKNNDWMDWPPNTFAITSDILKKTGCYRAVLYDKWHESFDGDSSLWQKTIEIEAQIWKREISKKLLKKFNIQNTQVSTPESIVLKNLNAIFPKPADQKIFHSNRLKQHVKKVRDRIKHTCFNDLRLLNQENITDTQEDLSDLVQSLIFIHSVCDEVCTGLGLSGSFNDSTSIFNCVANTLLISSGSLCTYDKQLCTVLPKMRTPQSGLTIRSFSHHLSSHTTEVEVIWRMIPWINFQENTLNILCICWPNRISNAFFAREGESFKPVNFFKYSDETEQSLNPADITRLIRQYKEQQGIERIHMVVFPEIALSDKEWNGLLHRLKLEYRNGSQGKSQVPVILAGVRDKKKTSVRKAHQGADSEEIGTNELRIATYFADKWYVISQRKHHRWSLDESQIKQYDLAGKFSTSKRWYEKIEISQRRLSIIAPNGWLSICPLICEDLAQLEPVSELIRGIGPTLLLTLLADGPQLDHRWSSRYASVFADDPGTSVLTLTSSGMLKKSSSKFVDKKKSDAGSGDDNKTLALWKDLISGVHPIRDDRISQDNHHLISNFLLTISAEWKEELTADGRTDHTNASLIKFQSISNEYISVADNQQEAQEPAPATAGEMKNAFQDWTDIKELSLATVVIELLITLRNKEYAEKLISPFVNASNMLDNINISDFYDALFVQIIQYSVDPKRAGVVTSKSIEDDDNGSVSTMQTWPTRSFKVLLWYLKTIFADLFSTPDNHVNDSIDTFYDALFHYIETHLKQVYEHPESAEADRQRCAAEYAEIQIESHTEELDFNRIKKACLLQILIILHNKLEHLRRKTLSGSKVHTQIFPSPDNHSISDRKQKSLFNKIENLLNIYGY